MSDITYPDKTTGGAFTAADANEIKSAVNSKADYENGNLKLEQIAKALNLTATVSATAGNLNGTTNYVVTFVTAYGETDSGAASNSVSPSNKQVNLTSIPVSPNPDVIARKIYRYPVGAADTVLKQLVTTINDNTTTTYTDDIADGSLGAPVPWVNTTGGSITINNINVANVSEFSTHMGYQAMGAGTGYANTAFGVYALKSLTVGIRNTAVGTDALQQLTTGSRNTAVGVHASDSNATSSDTTAIGYGALMACTAGSNTAVGAWALNASTTGTTNTSIGYKSLFVSQAAANNVSIGANSSIAITSGAQNTVVGTSALYKAATGGSNCAIGWSSLYNALGSGNVAIGSKSGYYETGSNKLYIDNAQRTDEADGRVKSLVYGVFDAAVANQRFTINGKLIVNYDSLNIGTAKTPASATGTGTAGDIAWDADYIYVCVASNSWKRVAITAW